MGARKRSRWGQSSGSLPDPFAGKSGAESNGNKPAASSEHQQATQPNSSKAGKSLAAAASNDKKGSKKPKQ